MRITPIPPEQQPMVRWRNGGGSTREIVRIGPESGYAWRASLARVDASGPFSAFPGYRRFSCLVDGGPLSLHWEDGRHLDLAPRLRAHAYAGAPAPVGRLESEAAWVFNLIAAEHLDEVQLIPRTLVGSMVFFDQAGTDWLVYLIGGEADLRLGDARHWLGGGHAVLLHGEGGGQRAVLDGGGEVVLAKVVGYRA